MLAFVEAHLKGSKARRRAHKMSLGAVYSGVYEKTLPTLEKALKEKEAELDAQLDAYRDLPPRLKERAVQRMKALQDEIDALRADLGNLRIPWDRLRADLAARREALKRATATLNQEGHFRQKTEALKCVVDKIVCHFKGTRLASVEMVPAEDAAVRPLTFPGPLLEDSCLHTMKRNTTSSSLFHGHSGKQARTEKMNPYSPYTAASLGFVSAHA
jgi:hypothetical protein